MLLLKLNSELFANPSPTHSCRLCEQGESKKLDPKGAEMFHTTTAQGLFL